MTVCLYKCLTVAGLQHHYARFTLMGVYGVAHLSTLRVEDYAILGVCSMEDRARLFQLVQLVKSLDLRSLSRDYVGIYNASEYEGNDEIFPSDNNSFSPDDYGNPNGAVRRERDESGGLMGVSNASHCRPWYAHRRLDFSAENTEQRLCSHFEDTIHVYASQSRNDEPVCENELATPIQPGLHGSTVACDLRQSRNSKLNERSRSCDPHNGGSTKLHVTRGSAVFGSHIRLIPKSKTCNKLNPSPAPVASETFANKSSAQKDRKTHSRRKNCSADVTKPVPVYEAKKAAGYNYGLPLSSPQAGNREVEGKRISVCVRKRPLTCAERKRGEADVVTTPSGERVVVHESKDAVDLTEYILQHRFHFDQVFGEESSNEEIYQKTAYPLVQHMLSGGKATCFAYGQTGAGKTHTMLGSSPGGTGLYALAAYDIFVHLSATRTSLQVYVSFFEIYCGQLYDLLEHRKRLFAREDGKKVVHISGLRDVRVDSVSMLLKVISQGTAERTQGKSGVNLLSSRSHALLQIQLRDLNQKVAGRMWFVDLAGSERASDVKEPSKRSRMEGAEINQSLLALKECIRSLDKEESHTPFRQSKLTQVLRDSFVGDSMTCMIANISPGHSATEHTLNTLRYADRVKELRGQNELTGRKRSGNMAHANKHNISGSNKRNRRNVGTNSPKLEYQNKTQTTRSHTWNTVFCSTPKKLTCEEEAQPRNRKVVRLEHISPIRGLPQSEGRCLSKGSEVRENRKTENERHNNIHSHCVKGKHTRAVRMLGQQNKGVVKGGDLTSKTYSKRESAICQKEMVNNQQTMRESLREEPERTNMRRHVKSCRDACREEEGLQERELLNADDTEKVRHLREYHQQLQQFLPSPTSSSLHPLSSSACPTQGSLSSLFHSSHISFSTHSDSCLEETSDVQTKTSAISLQNVAKDDKCEGERKVITEAAGRAAARNEDEILASKKKGEIRYCWVENTEMRSPHITANTDVHLPGCNDSEDRKEVDLQGLQTGDLARSSEQEGVSVYSRNPLFDSPHLQAITERPLSPVSEETSKISVLFQDNIPQDSSSSNMDPLSVSQLYVDQQAAPASFLQGEDNSSICPFKSESEKDERRETGNRCSLYLEKMEELVHDEYAEISLSPLELTHSKIPQVNTSAVSDSATATGHPERWECITSTVRGSGTNQPFLTHDHHNNWKKRSTLGNKVAASSFIQSIDDSGSNSAHNTLEYAQHTHSKSLPDIFKQDSELQYGCLNSVQPNFYNISSGEKGSNQQVKPPIHLFTTDRLNQARMCIIEAHLEQLKEMEAICHKEGELLCQQHDMEFVEFVHKLAEVLERKARCVHSMKAQLWEYLKTNHPSTHEDYENGNM